MHKTWNADFVIETNGYRICVFRISDFPSAVKNKNCAALTVPCASE